MPIDYKKYPQNWHEFSKRIRFERAKSKCEQCGVPNGEFVDRGFLDASKRNPIWWLDGQTHCAKTGYFYGWFRSYEVNLFKIVKIVLTVAHLDYKGGICNCKSKCAIDSHVLALCQRCHLAMDMPKRVEHQRENLTFKKDAERSLFADL